MIRGKSIARRIQCSFQASADAFVAESGKPSKRMNKVHLAGGITPGQDLQQFGQNAVSPPLEGIQNGSQHRLVKKSSALFIQQPSRFVKRDQSLIKIIPRPAKVGVLQPETRILRKVPEKLCSQWLGNAFHRLRGSHEGGPAAVEGFLQLVQTARPLGGLGMTVLKPRLLNSSTVVKILWASLCLGPSASLRALCSCQ